MRCLNCDGSKTAVTNSRRTTDGEVLRHRVCATCEWHFETIERVLADDDVTIIWPVSSRKRKERVNE